jgi:hypothetical protein
LGRRNRLPKRPCALRFLVKSPGARNAPFQTGFKTERCAFGVLFGKSIFRVLRN